MTLLALWLLAICVYMVTQKYIDYLDLVSNMFGTINPKLGECMMVCKDSM